ncbi:MAG: hypothetical protein HY674_19100, partial [Chloroflexi bacterium]|nr:hypothetical protein [Chloroflexota bacterium]
TRHKWVGDLSRPLTMDWAKEINDLFLRDDLTHCFAGNPQERFAGAGQLAKNLRSLKERKAAEAQQRAAVRRGVVRTIAGTVVVLVLVPVVAWFVLRWREARGVEGALKNFGAVYDGLKSYQDTAIFKIEEEYAGVKQELDGSVQIALAKPDKLNLTINISKWLTKLVSNGTQVWTFASLGSPQYTVRGLTNGLVEVVLREFFKDPLFSDSFLGRGPPAVLRLYRMLAGDDPQRALLENTKNIQKLGTQKIDGRLAYVLSWDEINGPLTVPTKVWVSKDSGLILQKTADLTSMFKEARKFQTNLPSIQKMLVTSKHRGVKINEPIPEGSFVLSLPPEARKVEQFNLNELAAALSQSSFPSFEKAELKKKIPPRDPRAKPSAIDLSDHYNVPLTEAWHPALTGNDLAPLPRGLQTFAGVEFDVRGFIQLSSQGIKDGGGKYPEQVGIEVGRRCERLHFLHAAVFGTSTTNGTKIGSYLIHYADGQQREFPLIYGRDVVDWWTRQAKPPTEAAVAWEGTNNASRAARSSIRVFKSTWENPLASVPLERINFTSSMALAAAPFLIAVTADLTNKDSAVNAANVVAELRRRLGVIDLSEYYNESLTLFYGEPPGNDLSSLPRGLQVFAGIKFDVRGLIHLSSRWVKQNTALQSAPYPEEVKGIKVGRKCQRVHFLHASHWVHEKDGTHVSSFFFNYTDGQKQELPIIYGQDLRDWWNRNDKPATDAMEAWAGTNRVNKAAGTSIHVYKRTWPNPRADVAIESIDFVSKMARPAPFLIAVTVDPVEPE